MPKKDTIIQTRIDACTLATAMEYLWDHGHRFSTMSALGRHCIMAFVDRIVEEGAPLVQSTREALELLEEKIITERNPSDKGARNKWENLKQEEQEGAWRKDEGREIVARRVEMSEGEEQALIRMAQKQLTKLGLGSQAPRARLEDILRKPDSDTEPEALPEEEDEPLARIFTDEERKEQLELRSRLEEIQEHRKLARSAKERKEVDEEHEAWMQKWQELRSRGLVE